MSGAFLRRFLAGLLLATLVVGPAWAKKPFGVTLSGQNGQGQPTTIENEYSSVDDTVDSLDPDALVQYFPNADSGQIGAEVDFRGLPQGMFLDFANGSAQLHFQVPLLGVDLFFGTGTCSTTCGDARREALRELRDYLQSNPAFLKSLLKALARYSPIDPLAGNPESLFSRQMRRDFQYGFTNKVSQIWACGTSAFNFTNDAPMQVAAAGDLNDVFRDAQARAAELQAGNEVGVGLSASTTTAKSTGGDYVTTGIDVPLSYTAKLDSDPRKKVHVDLPLSYTDTDGAASYSVGLGLAYSHPLSDFWSLTPAIGVAATGSDDLGSAGGVSSYSLTSAYTWRFDAFALSMGNGVGRYDSLGIKIGDVEAEADVHNTVFTNGLLLTGPNSFIAKNLVLEYSLVDTRITGDEVYTDAYDEIGVALGYVRTSMGVIDSYTKVGLSYLMASGEFDDIDTLRLTLSARF